MFRSDSDVSVGDPVIINRFTKNVTRVRTLPQLTSVKLKSNIISTATILNNELYYILTEDSKSYLVRENNYKTEIGSLPLSILSTSMIYLDDSVIIRFNSMIHRVNNTGNVFISNRISFNTGILVNVDKVFTLVTSFCNRIVLITYNSSLAFMNRVNVNFKEETRILSACYHRDKYIIASMYNTNQSSLVIVKDEILIKVVSEPGVIYCNVFCDSENYFVISRSINNVTLSKFNYNDEKVSYVTIPITLATNSLYNTIFYGGIESDNVYMTYNNFINDKPITILANFNRDLDLIWSLNVDGALSSILGNSAAVTSNKTYLSFKRFDNTTFNGFNIEGNFMTFKMSIPKLIGICVDKSCDMATVNFRDPSCFFNLPIGVEYYVENSKLTTSPLNNNRYLGTSISDTTILIK